MKRTYTERLLIKEFRMSLVNRIKDLDPAERAMEIDRIVAERHAVPFSKKTAVSRSTLYKWLEEHRNATDAGTSLMGKARSDSGMPRALTEEQKNALVHWRHDGPYRTIEDLRNELAEHDSTRTDPMPSASTKGRYVRAQGLSRKDL